MINFTHYEYSTVFGRRRRTHRKTATKQLQSIVRYLAKSEIALTIPEIAEHVKISVPTCTKLIKELVENNTFSKTAKKKRKMVVRPSCIHSISNGFMPLGSKY